MAQKRLSDAVADQFRGWNDFIISSGDESIPLHFLLPPVGPDFVQYLLATFDIHHASDDSRYHVETVLDNLSEWRKLREAIETFRLLVTNDIVESISDSGRDIGTQFCTAMSCVIGTFVEEDRYTFVKEDMYTETVRIRTRTLIEGLTKVLIENGALAAYESRHNESGVLPLIDILFSRYEKGLHCIWSVAEMVIQKSELFSRANNHPSIRRLADLLLQYNTGGELSFLFEHGLDPFSICEGRSQPLITEICGSQTTLQAFQNIVGKVTTRRSENDTPKGEPLL